MAPEALVRKLTSCHSMEKDEDRKSDQEQYHLAKKTLIPHDLDVPPNGDISDLQNKRSLHPFIESLLRSPIPKDGRLCLNNLNKNVADGSGTTIVSIDIIEQAFLLATNQIYRRGLSLSSGVGPEAVHELYIDGFSFSRLPEGIIGSIYTRIKYVTITDNPGLDCIGSIIRQFPKLEALFIRECPKITTLDPLRDIEENRLQQLAVSRCHLSEHGTDWDGVMRALGSSKGPLRVLDFSANDFTKFPKSVRLLGHTLERLHLANNAQLDSLPEDIGRFPELSLLDLRGNYEVCAPAKTIERITDYCEVIHPYVGYGSAYWDLLHYWRGLVKLSILFRRSRDRLREKKRLLSSIPSTPTAPETRFVPTFPEPAPSPAVVNNDLKVVFLGGRKMGKTTIVRRLSDNAGKGEKKRLSGASHDKHRTIDLDVHTCTFASQDDALNSKSGTTFNLWDFHQPSMIEDEEFRENQCDHQAPQSLFFTPNTLYVIVWDMGVQNDKISSSDNYFDDGSDDDSYDDFSRLTTSQCNDNELIRDIDNNILHWVECIRQSGVEGCAIMPVASFNDDFSGPHGLGSEEAQRRCDVMKTHVKEYFANDRQPEGKSLPSLQFGDAGNIWEKDGVIKLCSKKTEDIKRLKSAMLNATASCPSFSEHLNKPIPNLTLKVRDAIRIHKENHRKIIAVEDIQAMVGNNGLQLEKKDLLGSLHFLSSIGEILFYGRSDHDRNTPVFALLSEFVVLNPKWLASIVSCILCRDFWSRQGEDWRFGKSLNKIWKISSEIAAVSPEELSIFWKSIPSVRKELLRTSASKLSSFLNQVLVHHGVLVPVSKGAPQCDSFSEYSSMLSSKMYHEPPTSSSTWEASSQSTLFFLIPGLFASTVPHNAWSYKSKKSWKTTLAHSWEFPGTCPPRFMGCLTAAVMQDLTGRVQSCKENSPIRVLHCFCWKSAFVLRLGMKVTCEHSGEAKESIVDIFACLTSRESPFCVASSLADSSNRKLVVSAKGQVGGSGKRIWEGGFNLAVESVERTIRHFGPVVRTKEVKREIVCPDCLALHHCSTAGSWSKDRLLDSVAKGTKRAYCSRGHCSCLCVLCGLGKDGVTVNNSSKEIHSSTIISKLLPGVVIVGLWDEEKQQITEAGSGFVVDRKNGLIMTAAHVLIDLEQGKNFGKEKHGKAAIGFISRSRRLGKVDTTKADFRYFAEIVAKDVCNVDACVLRITSKVHDSVEDEKLQHLKLTSKCELNESVFLLGFNQRVTGLQSHSTGCVNQHLDCSRGYVRMPPRYPIERKDASNSQSFVPRAEIVLGDCRVYGGHSGGPCLNQDGKVIGILSRADPADCRQCYIAPASELKHLLGQSREIVQAAEDIIGKTDCEGLLCKGSCDY